MRGIYQRLFEELNDDNKYLRCPDVQDNNFEVLIRASILDKVDLVCKKTVK